MYYESESVIKISWDRYSYAQHQTRRSRVRRLSTGILSRARRVAVAFQSRTREMARRHDRRNARARVAVAIAVAALALLTGGRARADSSARDERAREAALGAKWWKSITKGVTKAANVASGGLVSSTSKAWSQSYNWAADTAKEASAVNKFGESSVNAFESLEIARNLNDYYDASKGFSSKAVDELTADANELAKDMTKVANMIADFFNGLKCDVSASTLKSYLNTLVNQAGVSRINNLIKLFNSDRSNFWNNLQGPLCDTMWSTVFPATTAVADIIKAFVTEVKSACPAAMSGSNLPAFAIGFVASGDVYSVASAGVGMELALGVTLTGDRFCYVAGCAYSGVTFGDPGASVSAGISVTGFKSIAAIPGSDSFLSLGVGVEIPGTPIGATGGVSYTYSGKNFADIIGVGVMMGGELGTDAMLPVSVTLAKGVCFCPKCVTTSGTPCGEKEPSKAFGVVKGDYFCGGTSAKMSCPASNEVVAVKSAMFGRKDSSTCECTGCMSNTNCAASNSLEKVMDYCAGQNNCEFNADNDVFGDPCFGTGKYLAVDYECAVPKEVVACEGNWVSLSCPSGYSINVHYARYGRDDTSTCSASSNNNCNSANSMSKVGGACSGQNSCSVKAGNDVFGEPCKKIGKYLRVRYTCVNTGVSQAMNAANARAALGHEAPASSVALADRSVLPLLSVIAVLSAALLFAGVAASRRRRALRAKTVDFEYGAIARDA